MARSELNTRIPCLWQLLWYWWNNTFFIHHDYIWQTAVFVACLQSRGMFESSDQLAPVSTNKPPTGVQVFLVRYVSVAYCSVNCSFSCDYALLVFMAQVVFFNYREPISFVCLCVHSGFCLKNCVWNSSNYPPRQDMLIVVKCSEALNAISRILTNKTILRSVDVQIKYHLCNYPPISLIFRSITRIYLKYSQRCYM